MRIRAIGTCVCVCARPFQSANTYIRKKGSVASGKRGFFPYFIQAVRVYVYCVWPFYDGHTTFFFIS